MTNKERFKEIFISQVTRPGAAEDVYKRQMLMIFAAVPLSWLHSTMNG